MSVADLGERAWIGSDRTWLGALGLLTIAVVSLWAFGPIGLGGAVLIGLAWLVLPGAMVLAIGHLLLLPLEPSLAILMLLEAGFIVVLTAPFVEREDWFIGIGSTVVASLLLGGIVWLGWQHWQPRWLTGVVVLGIVALGLYALHRYALVTADLQGVEPLQ